MNNLCAWSEFEPATIKFCEAPLCELIVHPSNSYSNLAYVIVAIIILMKFKFNRLSLMISFSAFCVGLFSFSFHATGTFLGQLLDVTSMYLFSALLLILNLNRMKWISDHKVTVSYILLVIGSSLLMYFGKSAVGETLFGLQVFSILITEWKIKASKIENNTQYRAIINAFIIFIVSFIFWLMDHHPTFCNPDQHFFQWHAAWHIVNSLCFYQAYKFYAQFKKLN